MTEVYCIMQVYKFPAGAGGLVSVCSSRELAQKELDLRMRDLNREATYKEHRLKKSKRCGRWESSAQYFWIRPVEVDSYLNWIETCKNFKE